tara:strand:- start:423 stop:689 length:267 start_codon:yes stop_codon:yes gene_type:complete
MKIHPDELPNDIELLKSLLLEQTLLLGEKDAQLVKWQSKYALILEQWRLAQQKQFGKSSELSPSRCRAGCKNVPMPYRLFMNGYIKNY